MYDEVRFVAVDELRALLQKVDAGEVERFTGALTGARCVFVAGVGRAGLAMRSFAMRLAHLGFPVHVIGDVTTPAFTAADILVIGSGSGATTSLVGMAEKAKMLGGRVSLVTTDPGSPIGRLADAVVRIPGSTPKGAAERSAPVAGGEAPGRVTASRPGEGGKTASVLISVQPMATLFEQALGILLDSCVIRATVTLSYQKRSSLDCKIQAGSTVSPVPRLFYWPVAIARRTDGCQDRGIRSPVERMNRLGGRLDIRSDRTRTSVTAILPLSAMRETT